MTTLDQSVALFRVLADSSRQRLLLLLLEHELTVAEIVKVTGLSQPRVSTHLGKLREAGLVRDRRVGTSNYYAATTDSERPAELQMWIQSIQDDALIQQDKARVEQVLRGRENGWADSVAGQMERHYSPGRTWEATGRAMLGLLELGDVLDMGSGDGMLATVLAGRCESLTCVDISHKVITAAQQRLQINQGVRFSQGDMHAMPFKDESFDQILAMNVLTYTIHPEQVLAEASRLLRDGGVLTGVTLHEHEHRDVVAQFDHHNLGYQAEGLVNMLNRQGLQTEQCEVIARERTAPYFEVLAFRARKA